MITSTDTEKSLLKISIPSSDLKKTQENKNVTYIFNMIKYTYSLVLKPVPYLMRKHNKRHNARMATAFTILNILPAMSANAIRQKKLKDIRQKKSKEIRQKTARRIEKKE